MTDQASIDVLDIYQGHGAILCGLSVNGGNRSFPLVIGCSLRTLAGEIIDLPARTLSSAGKAFWQIKVPSACGTERSRPIQTWKGQIIFAVYPDMTFSERLADTGWIGWETVWMIGSSPKSMDHRDEHIDEKYRGRFDALVPAKDTEVNWRPIWWPADPPRIVEPKWRHHHRDHRDEPEDANLTARIARFMADSCIDRKGWHEAELRRYMRFLFDTLYHWRDRILTLGEEGVLFAFERQRRIGEHKGMYYPAERRVGISDDLKHDWPAVTVATIVHEAQHAWSYRERGDREPDLAERIEDEVVCFREQANVWEYLRTGEERMGAESPEPGVRVERSPYAANLDELIEFRDQKRLREYVLTHGGYQEHFFGRELVE